MLRSTIVICASLAFVNSARILVVVPTPAISHQVVFRPLIEELINRDHEVVVITPHPAFPEGKSPKNLKEIDLHDLTYRSWNTVYDAAGKSDQINLLSIMTVVFHMLHKAFQNQLKDEAVQKIINDKIDKFDLLILEECVVPTLIFSQIFNAPVIVMSSFGDNRGSMNVIGTLTHPILYPNHFHQRIYNLTFWEKIYKLYNHMSFKYMYENLEIQDDKRLQNLFGHDTPTLNQLRNNVHMLFLNIHPIWVHNQPVPLNFAYTWGIHKAPEEIICEDLQAYLDSSKNGAIYVSFGTNVKTSSIHPKTLEILLGVFSRLPYNILWKWDSEELPNKSENIRISKWFPQSDLLKHPNLKIFITQGGLQSTDEAINAGVPLVGIPIFADQEYNTEKYVYFKIGVKLNLKSLTVEKLENAIDTVVTNYDSYKKNIIDLRTQMHDQPKPALANAVWWVEYILRQRGVRHLRAPAANMSWAEYYELELILVVLTTSLVIGFVILLTLYSCLKSVYLSYKVHVSAIRWFC